MAIALRGILCLKGKCVENEVDGLLYRGSEVILLEAKHHANPHTKTSLDIPREAQSIIEDVVEGYELGYPSVKLTGNLIVCNTKLTDQAVQYANCRGSRFISWKHPLGHGLENLIEEHNVYPTTLLQEVNETIEAALGDAGIVSLEQLAADDSSNLARRSGIDKAKLQGLIKRLDSPLNTQRSKLERSSDCFSASVFLLPHICRSSQSSSA